MISVSTGRYASRIVETPDALALDAQLAAQVIALLSGSLTRVKMNHEFNSRKRVHIVLA